MALSPLLLSFIIILHFLLPTLYSLNPYPPPDTTSQGLLVEEKTRLGSTPPSCHNKCNNCHPCTAVQVPPALPSQGGVQPAAPAAAAESRTRVKPLDYYFDSSTSLGEGNRYSNYKPLGWKCRCDGQFYNP